MKKAKEKTCFRSAVRGAAKACLCSLLCIAAVCFSSCAGKPPELEDVREQFESLIRSSAGINDIFFGSGLPVYDRETSSGDGNASYDETSRTYYWLIEDKDLGTVVKYYPEDEKVYRYALKVYIKEGESAEGTEVYTDGAGTFRLEELKDYKEVERELVYSDDSPKYYDYVRLDCPYQSVDQIKEAAEKVYSSKYLESIYTIMFDGMVVGNDMIYARYTPDESGKTDFLFKSNLFEPYFTVQTEYDFQSMKIVMPSRAEFVNVEITATGPYLNLETLEKETRTYRKILKFVLQDGQWRLDTPTY